MEPVDYASHEVAHRYAHGRDLSDAVLDRWQAAVDQFAPPRTGDRVVDVGAGTGIFTRAWSRWRQCAVVAVEPSLAMRAQLIDAGVPDGAHVVGGRGEALPIRSGSVTIAWLSAVVHHLDSLDACGRELRRILTDDGVVLIRGLFAESPAPLGLRFLPGWERAVSSYPSIAGIERTLATAGFALGGRLEVVEMGPATIGDAAHWIRSMRHADSLLKRFTEAEISAGLAALDERDPDEPIEPGPLTLLAFATGTFAWQ